MEQLESNSKVIGKLCWFFIITGLIEIFVYVFITTKFYAIIPGLITIIPAYFTLKKVNVKRKYFVGIWPLIKYNPFSFALVAFILGDFFGPAYNNESMLFILFFALIFILGVPSLILGIILIIKISKHNKLINIQAPGKINANG